MQEFSRFQSNFFYIIFYQINTQKSFNCTDFVLIQIVLLGFRTFLYEIFEVDIFIINHPFTTVFKQINNPIYFVMKNFEYINSLFIEHIDKKKYKTDTSIVQDKRKRVTRNIL